MNHINHSSDIQKDSEAFLFPNTNKDNILTNRKEDFCKRCKGVRENEARGEAITLPLSPSSKEPNHLPQDDYHLPQ